MLGFLSQSRPKIGRTPNRFARLGVERLDERLCPSGGPPQITLDVAVFTDHQVQLSGYVSGEQLEGVNVTFEGAASGATTTDATGFYSFTTNQAVLGTVSAVGVTSSQQSTNQAEAVIAVAAPELTISISSVWRDQVTVTGQLGGLDCAGQIIYFGGVLEGNVQTDSSGNFSIQTTAMALGTITAGTTDLWGQSSNIGETTLTSDTPIITGFTTVYEEDNVWTFQGQVTDEDAAGLLIYFGGLESLQGQTATVGADGWFYFTRTLQAGERGTVTAQTADWWWLYSDIALADVS